MLVLGTRAGTSPPEDVFFEAWMVIRLRPSFSLSELLRIVGNAASAASAANGGRCWR